MTKLEISRLYLALDQAEQSVVAVDKDAANVVDTVLNHVETDTLLQEIRGNKMDCLLLAASNR